MKFALFSNYIILRHNALNMGDKIKIMSNHFNLCPLRPTLDCLRPYEINRDYIFIEKVLCGGINDVQLPCFNILFIHILDGDRISLMLKLQQGCM